MVPGGGTCLPSFPPPSPRHPGSGAARAEYALLPPSSVHPPIHRSLTRESVGSAASEIFSVGKLSVCPGAASSVENLSATTTRGRLRYKSILLNLVDASHVILRKTQFLQKELFYNQISIKMLLVGEKIVLTPSFAKSTTKSNLLTVKN